MLGKGVDRLTVGLGMIPRGEVGLIFANIGLGLTVGGERIVDAATFSAIVVMVIVTTMVTPPALKWSLGRMSEGGLTCASVSPGTTTSRSSASFLPYLAIKSSRVLGTRPLPPKVKHFISQIITLTIFFVLSAFVARSEWIDVFPGVAARAAHVRCSARRCSSLSSSSCGRCGASRVEARSRKVWLFMPRTPQERVLWVGCLDRRRDLGRGDLSRRDVRPLVAPDGKRRSPAALIAAVVFSISHFLQGWKSMAIIFGIALAVPDDRVVVGLACTSAWPCTRFTTSRRGSPTAATAKSSATRSSRCRA